MTGGRGRSLEYQALTVLLWGGNRVVRACLRRGPVPQAFALLETTGRRTGRPRHTPVGNGLDRDAPDVFWLVAAHGHQADYVRNLSVRPRVRVKIGRVWRSGTAVLCPEDDVRARSLRLPHQWDAAIGRALATTPLVIRIDLDDARGRFAEEAQSPWPC